MTEIVEMGKDPKVYDFFTSLDNSRQLDEYRVGHGRIKNSVHSQWNTIYIKFEFNAHEHYRIITLQATI